MILHDRLQSRRGNLSCVVGQACLSFRLFPADEAGPIQDDCRPAPARFGVPSQDEYTMRSTMTQPQKKTRRQMLEEFVAAKPNDAFARYGLAMECANSGDAAAADEHFKTLLGSHPDYVAAYFQYGQFLARSRTHRRSPLDADRRHCHRPRDRRRSRALRDGSGAGRSGLIPTRSAVMPRLLLCDPNAPRHYPLPLKSPVTMRRHASPACLPARFPGASFDGALLLAETRKPWP